MAQRTLAIILFLSLSPSWIQYPSAWIPSREYSFVACALAVWHLLRVRRRLDGWAPEYVTWIALPAMSLAWWAALTTNVQVGHLLLTPVILFTWLGATTGRAAMVAAAPAALVFLIAVPFWEMLNPLLQGMAVLFSQAILGILDIDATIRGTSIFLRSGIIEVADSCSGLHFLMVGLTIASCYAFFFAKRRRTQSLIVLMAAVLAIFANWVRVVGLVLIGEWTAMKSPLLADHEFYGWVIFAGALAVFFPLAFRLERRDHAMTGVGITATDSSESFETRRPVRSAVTPCLLAMLGPVLAGSLALMPANTPTRTIPLPNVREISADASADSTKVTWSPRFDGAQHNAFLSTRATPVRVDRYWYGHQSQGAELVGGGNHIAHDSVVIARRLVGPLDESFRTVQETVIRADSASVVVVWSFYRVGGVETSSSAKAKLLQIPAALRGRSDAEAVLVSTTCALSDCGDAVRALYMALTGKEPPRESPTAGTPASR